MSDDLKRDFAAHWLRYPDDPFKAAFLTTPDTGQALQIAKNWVKDPVVLAAKDALLLSSDALNYLPTKEQQCKDIYALATDTRQDAEDRLKAHRLYAEVRGFIEKPVGGSTTNILNQGVMIVRDAGTDEQWQEKAAIQQRTLIADASVN